MQQKTTESYSPDSASPGDTPDELTFPYSMKLVIILLAIICLVSNPVAMLAQMQTITLHFAFDSSHLSADHMETLQSAVAAFDAGRCQVAIAGHTDTTGNLAYNRLLSEQRAHSVQTFLIVEGVPAENLTIEFFGETIPINPGEAAINRRVEIQIDCPQKSSDIQDLFIQLAPPAETFTVNTDRDTILVTEQGTLLYVRKNSFGIPPRVRDRNVELLVRDRRKKSSLILENLTTVSPGGDLYTSQLMLHIDARYQGYRPVLKRDITVFSPADTIIPGLRLLNGIAAGDDGHVVWLDPRAANVPVYKNPGSIEPLVGNAIFPDTIVVDSTYESLDSIYRYLFEECKFICKICRSDILNNIRMCRRLRTERNANKDSALIKRTVVDSIVRYEIPRAEYIARLQADRQRFPSASRWITEKIRYDEIETKFEEMDSERLQDVSRNDLEYYTFNTRYGWSNLDWLNKVSNPVNFSVNIKPDKDTQLRIVFKDQRSIIPLYNNRDKYMYNGLPNGTRAWLVGLRYRKEIPSFALREITIGAEGIDDLEFEELTIGELKERLKVLDL